MREQPVLIDDGDGAAPRVDGALLAQLRKEAGDAHAIEQEDLSEFFLRKGDALQARFVRSRIAGEQVQQVAELHERAMVALVGALEDEEVDVAGIALEHRLRKNGASLQQPLHLLDAELQGGDGCHCRRDEREFDGEL